MPHALAAIDGKHIAIKEPKKLGSCYYNYKGFFSVVLLAFVDGQYRFRWVDLGSQGCCPDAQIFNSCQLKDKIEDGSIGFSEPAPIVQGGRDIQTIEYQEADMWWRMPLAYLLPDSGPC